MPDFGRNSVQDTLKCELLFRSVRVAPSPVHTGSLPRRYACLTRLLADTDECFLREAGFVKEAREMRAQHRRIYWRLLQHLEKDTLAVLTQREQVMITAGAAATLQSHIVLKMHVRAVFLSLRGAAVLHALHAHAAVSCLERGLAGVEAMFSAPAGVSAAQTI